MNRIVDGASGSLRFRGLATWVQQLLINDGSTTIDYAGQLGDFLSFATPRWKANGTITYENPRWNVDMRVRFLSGGVYDKQLPITNNDVASRTYFDIDAQVKIEKFVLYASISNLFDRSPPLITYGSPIYDEMGRYFSGGVKINF